MSALGLEKMIASFGAVCRALTALECRADSPVS